MRIARLTDGESETYGFVDGTRVATREEMMYHTGVPVPHNVKDFLFEGWYGEVMRGAGGLPFAGDLSRYRMLAPIPNPGKVICLAFNYVDHAREQGLSPPSDPALVIKPRTALNGDGGEIVCPGFVTQLDYEVELALVVGRDCKDVPASEAQDAVFGYMILNDVSARDIQAADKQFTRGKGFDSFAPCGPWITTADEVADAQDLRMTTRVNGEVRQDSSTSNMFIKIPDIISKISRVMTLEKGDIISTGTPAGVMLNKPGAVFLGDGDRIEMEIEGLGTLSNTVSKGPA